MTKPVTACARFAADAARPEVVRGYDAAVAPRVALIEVGPPFWLVEVDLHQQRNTLGMRPWVLVSRRAEE